MGYCCKKSRERYIQLNFDNEILKKLLIHGKKDNAI
jgi:hypothetical protein